MRFVSKYPEQLSTEKRQELEKFLKTTKDVKVYRRAKVILYLYDGYPTEFVAQHTDYTRRAQYYWLRRYTLEGVQGLYDHPRSGRPLKKSEFLAPELDLKDSPLPELPAPGEQSPGELPLQGKESLLSEPARLTLGQMHKNHPKRYLRDRAQMVLLKNRHYSIEAVADILAMTPTTVRRVLLTYERNHLVGLYREVGSGRPAGLKKSQWEEIFQGVESSPKALEYRFAIWTTRSLRYQISKRFNRWYSREWIRQILHDPFRYSWTRAKKVYAYLSPQEREEFKQNLQGLLQQAYAHEIILLFEDETLIDPYGSVGYSWSPLGQTQQVLHPGKKKSGVVFGAINPVSGQSHYRLEEAINQDTPLRFLKQLQAYYHKHQPGQKLVVVWDKHPGHIAESVINSVAFTDLLELVPTPTQSPDLNPMERLWDWLEDQMIKNAFFQTVDEIKKAARHFFSYLRGVKERVIQLMGTTQNLESLPEIVPPLRV